MGLERITVERGDELKERTVEALQRALEAAGIEFINGGKLGVRLTRFVDTAERSKPAAAKAGRGQAANAPPEEAIRYGQRVLKSLGCAGKKSPGVYRTLKF